MRKMFILQLLLRKLNFPYHLYKKSVSKANLNNFFEMHDALFSISLIQIISNFNKPETQNIPVFFEAIICQNQFTATISF